MLLPILDDGLLVAKDVIPMVERLRFEKLTNAPDGIRTRVDGLLESTHKCDQETAVLSH